jgi:hypothetical protein
LGTVLDLSVTWMLATSVLACYRSVGLVTEDAGPQASKSTNHSQLPDIWNLAMPPAAPWRRPRNDLTSL